MNFIYTDITAKTEVKGNLESWFLNQSIDKFPGKADYGSYYKTLKDKLKVVQRQVTQGADNTDGTSLTWHDASHIETVIEQASALLSYTNVTISPFEAFILLVSIQIHDIMNSDGRDGHEERAIEIFSILELSGIIESVIKRTIDKIINCHSGTFTRSNVKEKDKIGYLLQPFYNLKGEKIKMQFLAAILRLADEYADNENRAMSYLLKLGKIQKSSEIHHKYAECLHAVHIESNTGIVKFDFHIEVPDAIKLFEKQVKEKETIIQVFLIDEIFSRILKSFHETIYCMRFLRPDISISKLSIHIEIELKDHSKELSLDFELVEKGYPIVTDNILELCEDKLKLNGSYWSGENLKKYIQKHNLN
jgi:hypothetical protein